MKKSSILVMILIAIAAILYYLAPRSIKEYNAGRAIITEEDWECE